MNAAVRGSTVRLKRNTSSVSGLLSSQGKPETMFQDCCFIFNSILLTSQPIASSGKMKDLALLRVTLTITASLGPSDLCCPLVRLDMHVRVRETEHMRQRTQPWREYLGEDSDTDGSPPCNDGYGG
jgi:hypothetical protein